MPTIIATTIGLCVWIVVWALGAKPIDAFLLALVIILPAAAYQVFGPGIKKALGGSPPDSQ